ncbi:MAG: carboxypeptidase-like regulatory domain-containing protein [Muribaculaceae bacterium]|nr:carboxypeptidase-like regulatory domain-containing protein [Muribaculaceae bacterium]
MRKTYIYSLGLIILSLFGLPLSAYANKSLKVNSSGTKMTSPANNSSVYMQGTVIPSITMDVNLTNNGDEVINPGDEDYTLTLQLRYITNLDLAKVNIPEAIEPGQSKTVTVTFGEGTGIDLKDLPESRYQNGMVYIYGNLVSFLVREDVKKTTVAPVSQSYLYIYQDAPNYSILAATGTANLAQNLSFGFVGDDPRTINVRVYSQGARDLTVNSLSLPEGFSTSQTFPVTVPGGVNAATPEEQYLTIPVTFNPQLPGMYSGEMAFTFQDFEEPAVYNLSGAKRDVNAYFMGFENDESLAGWILGNYIRTSNRNPQLILEGDTVMLDHYQSGLTNISKAITPKLSFREGDKLMFEARANTGYGTGFPTVKVYYSTDRINWTLGNTRIYVNDTAEAHADATDLFNITSPYPFGVYSCTMPEGQYYVAFEMCYASIDNVSGGKLVEVPYDVYCNTVTAPTSMMVNKGSNFTATYRNLDAEKGIKQNEYTVELYVDGQKVQSAETFDWAPDSEMTYSFNYVPHKVGETTAYILMKVGDIELKSEEYIIPVSEEVLVAEATVGTASAMSSTNAKVPFYFYYKNSTSDIILPQDYLAKYGITPGAVITGMTIVGYSQSVKDLKGEISVKMTTVDASSLAAGDPVFDLTAIDPVYTADAISLAGGSMTNVSNVIDFTFTTPFTYTGGNLLIQSTAENLDSYVNTYYQFTNELTANARVKQQDNYNSYLSASYALNTTVPVITFGLAVSPGTLSGVVTHNDLPVANATVTLTGSDDVIYTTTTDEAGAYSMTVFQTEKSYTLTATADGLVMYKSTEPITFDVNDKVIDIDMNGYAIVSGNVSSVVNGAVADALVGYTCGEYTASALTDENGDYTLNIYEFGPEALVSVDAADYVYTSKTIDMSVPQNMVVDFAEMASFTNNRDYTLTINVASVVEAPLSNLPFTLKSVRFDETYPASETILDENGRCTLKVYGGAQKLVIKTVGTEQKTVDFNVNRDYEHNVLLGEDVQNPSNIQTVLIHDAISGKNDLLVTWNPNEAAVNAVRRVMQRSARNPYESFIISMDGTKVGETDEYEYVIENVAGGTHMITVTAKYATTQSDAVTVVSEITNDNYVPVVISVTNNADADLNGVAVNLHGDSDYVVSLENDRAIIGYLPKGKYDVTLNLYGFNPYAQTFDFDEPAFVDIDLTEIVAKPYNLTAEAIEDIENNCFVVTADWNQVFGMSDSFESYHDFATQFGDWKTIDNNSEPSYPMMWGSKLVTFPGSSTVANPVAVAPTIFNPENTEPSMAGESSVAAYDGKKTVIFQGPQASKADKWIISPVVDIKPGFECSFAAKAYSLYPEALEVCVSTDGDDPESFTVLETVVPGNANWTIYTEDLSAYAGQQIRIGLHCVSEDGFMLQIDDFKVFNPASEEAVDMGNVINYEVSVADLKLNTQDTHCKVENVPAGNHVLGVKAVYASGASEEATYPLTLVSGINGIAADAQVGDVVAPTGIVVLRNATAEQLRSLDKGIYIVGGRKVVVK